MQEEWTHLIINTEATVFTCAALESQNGLRAFAH